MRFKTTLSAFALVLLPALLGYGPETVRAEITAVQAVDQRDATEKASSGIDMSRLFKAGDKGVTEEQMRHAIEVANALPDNMKSALLRNNASITLLSGWQLGRPQGANNGIQGFVFVDGDASPDQTEVHEIYEMAGRLDPSLKGGWGDARAVEMSDRALLAGMPAGNPGNLNDTVGNVRGDGDLMANVFVANFFATHPDLYQDERHQSTLITSVLNAPELSDYVAQAFGLKDATSFLKEQLGIDSASVKNAGV